MKRLVFVFFLLAVIAFPADFTKSTNNVILDWTNVGAGDQSTATPSGQDATDIINGLAVSIVIEISPETTNADGTEIRIESSQASSGDEDWVILSTFLSTKSAVNSNAVDGTEAAGQTVIEETTTTNLAEGQLIFFKNGTIANSEIGILEDLTGSTSFELLEGITNAQTSSTWYNQAEKFYWSRTLDGITRLQVVLNNNVFDDGDEDVVNWRVSMIFTTAIE